MWREVSLPVAVRSMLSDFGDTVIETGPRTYRGARGILLAGQPPYPVAFAALSTSAGLLRTPLHDAPLPLPGHLELIPPPIIVP
jgi:hypothetical protein